MQDLLAIVIVLDQRSCSSCKSVLNCAASNVDAAKVLLC